MKPLIQLKQTSSLFLVALLLGCFAFSPGAQAVVPAPDGGYPNFTTAEGDHALNSLTTGLANTAVGWFSLSSATTGSFNTGVGAGTLDLTTANENTAIGAGALLLNTSGLNNTANGAFALIFNNIGSDNTAVGDRALENNAASGNTAVGSQALLNNTTGSGDTANGAFALFNNTTGSGNIALGFNSGTGIVTANDVTCIGAGVAGADVSNTTWIGSVYGVTTQSGTTAPVVVSDTGQLGTVASSERSKKDIATMDKGSEAILSLRPVTFHYKSDVKDFPQFGLIAEEVAKVNPALVLPDKDGKPYSVRYEAVNAMLLNEFLKEHRTVQEQKTTITELKSTMAQQQKQIDALTAGLQKVSAQLEVSKPAPQTVLNSQ